MIPDACCPSCRGAFGICKDRNCFHHLERVAAENRDKRSLHRHNDPTAHGRTNLERRER